MYCQSYGLVSTDEYGNVSYVPSERQGEALYQALYQALQVGVPLGKCI